MTDRASETTARSQFELDSAAAAAATPNENACQLCGTAIRWGMRQRRGRVARYCCSGCMHVAEILRSVSPDTGRRLLAQARRLGIVPAAGSLPEAAERADRRVERKPRASPPGEAQRAERFLVEGYACPSCAWLVSAVLWQQPGVLEAQADFLSDTVRVRYDMRRIGPGDLAAALGGLGYRLAPLAEEQHAEDAAFSRLLGRFVLALFLALNAMMLSAVHWAAYLEWIPPVDLHAVAFVQLVLVLPLVGLGVWPLFKRSLQLIRMGRPSMDLLFVLGFAAAFSLSLAAFFTEASRFYFDACAAFVAIALFGRLVEGKLRQRAARELRGLLRVSASKVAVLQPDGRAVYLHVDRVEPGQTIAVEPGQTVPFDGTLAAERPGLLSEAMLTGEPAPVLKRPGDIVHAGSNVLGDTLCVRVARPYRQSRLQQIADGVAQTLTRNELRMRTADGLAAWFVPAVLAVAGVTFGLRLWLFGGGALSPELWMPTISVLLVACPCAFGIATASALAVSVSALLRHGVLVKEGGALERLAAVDLLALDKTGTLTSGRWRLQRIRWFGEREDQVLAAVAGAEKGVDHPLAHVLQMHIAGELGLAPRTPDEVEMRPGQGLIARFAGRRLHIGSPALFAGVPDLPELTERTTVVFFGFDGRAAGCFLLTDRPRPGTEQVIALLSRRGIEPVVLSGDRQPVVSAVAAEVGIARAHGGMRPEDKREAVANLARAGRRVAFAGDGTNDAPAMVEADVAISLSHGTDLSLAAAQILPLAGDLEVLPKVVQVAEHTRRTIGRNFGWAFVYNALFLPLAALGYLHPIFAALLMLLSSTTVLLSSLRLRPVIERTWKQMPTVGEQRVG